MSEPRNVTPDGGPGSDEFHRRFYSERGAGPEWTGWNWARRGWNFPWLGVLLVLVGVGLLVQYFVPTLGVGTLVLLAIALAFLAAYAFGGARFAMTPGLLILAVAMARLVDDLNIYRGPGTTSLCLAGAFAFIWVIGYARGGRSTWSLWGLAIFGLIGLVQVSGRIVGMPELGALWPILVIALGLLLLLSSRRR